MSTNSVLTVRSLEIIRTFWNQVSLRENKTNFRNPRWSEKFSGHKSTKKMVIRDCQYRCYRDEVYLDVRNDLMR